MRSADAIARCDVALVLMDATEPCMAQDSHIVQLVEESHKGLILVLNKIDLLEAPNFRQDLTRLMRSRFKFAPWAPLAFISAKEHRGLTELLNMASLAAEQRSVRVSTGALNSLLQRAFVEHAPRSVQGRRLKLLYATQAEVSPPTFVVFVNDAQLLHFSYQRYLENRLRQAYGFLGTAVRLLFKSRGDGIPPPTKR
jgi:GTP-binding protein